MTPLAKLTFPRNGELSSACAGEITPGVADLTRPRVDPSDATYQWQQRSSGGSWTNLGSAATQEVSHARGTLWFRVTVSHTTPTPPTPNTPTPMPAPCPTTHIGEISFAGSTSRFSGRYTWGPACDNRGNPVHRFTFQLPEVTSPYRDREKIRRTHSHWHHVTVTLTSTGGLDEKIILAGFGESDGNVETPADNAFMGRTLRNGPYSLIATLTDSSALDPDAEFTLTIRSEKGVPHPSRSHQPDHTAVYYFGDFQSASYIEGRILRDAIDSARQKWNAVADTGWWNVEMCEVGTGGCSSNDDRRQIEVNSEPGTCTTAPACLKGRLDEHMTGSTTLTFEVPGSASHGGNSYVVDWTDDPDDHAELIDGRLHFFALSTALHELGHTLGLDDLYGNEYGDVYDDYLMGSPGVLTVVPATDLSYLKQVYRHHGGIPH